MTVLFAALGAHSLWRVVTARQAFAVTGHLCHLGMNLVMVAMVWPWWVRLPAPPQLAFFVLAAVFFAAAAGWHQADALTRGPTAGSRGPTAADPRPGHHENPGTQAIHAVMMLAMVWAVVVMHPGLTVSRTLATGHEAGRGHHTDQVAGQVSGQVGDHAVAHAQLGTWSTVSGALLLAALAVGGTVFLVGLLRHLRGGGSVRGRAGSDLLASSAMSFGMAAMCWLMLAG
ncbi:DUF5134 domain-containing protein [Promicromonospora sp. NPDC060271]|uniref:DUF5134 domain-containing protein n=1 Tax=Promicromonospora sp. NPDC060271 TaxID=3347089 RepID=UPI003663CC97